MSTLVPVNTGSTEVNPPRSLEVKPQEPVKIMNGAPPRMDEFDENFPSTSKIHIVQFKGDGGGYESMALYDSYVLDDREYIQRRYANQFNPSGYRWRCHVNRDDDSSDYSDSEDDDDNLTGESTGDMFYASQPSPVLQKSRGNHLYHSVPLEDSGGNYTTNDEVCIVETSFNFTQSEQPALASQRDGDPFYKSAPSLCNGEAVQQCDYQSVAENKRVSVNDHRTCTQPKDSKIKSKKSTHHSSTTQGENSNHLQDRMTVPPNGSKTERRDHHSCSQRVGGDPFYFVAAAASPGRSGQKHDHRHSQVITQGG